MITKPITAILAAALLVSTSGTIGSFYFVSSQGQITTGSSLTLSENQASPGAMVEMVGSNFGANSQVLIYFMSSLHVDLINGTAFILQGIDENQSTTIEPEDDSIPLDVDNGILNTLENLLGLRTDQVVNDTTTTTANTTLNIVSHNLLVALEESGPFDGNGTVSLECEDEIIAEGHINGTLGVLTVNPGTYNECSISISIDDIVDSGEIDNLVVVSDSDYENSLVASVNADEDGTFESSVSVPDVEEGEYALLAISDDGRTAVSELLVTFVEEDVTEPEDIPPTNVTEDITNETIIEAPEEEEEDVTEPEDIPPTNVTEDITNETIIEAPEEEEEDVTEPEDIPPTNVTEDITNETIIEAPEEEEEDVTEPEIQNQTAVLEDVDVQVDETTVQPGSPLAISGEGFQPNILLQIFINNVQITNVITNVEGSFNTVILVPTTVTTGSAEVVVRTEQTNIIQNVNIIDLDRTTQGPSTLRLTAVSATDNGEALRNAPVTIIDASTGLIIDSGRTPMNIELQEGTYSIFYSNFGRFEFESAEPGTWIDTPGGGSGLITIREGRNVTMTALYSEIPAPPPPPRDTENSITFRAQDTEGNLIPGMFVTIYDAEAAEKIDQGFTELRIDDLSPGTYPISFSNSEELVFVSASSGTWIQTPFGGVGLVTIPDDGEDHDIVVTATYDRIPVVEEQFNIQAPLNLEGSIFTITSNQTRPEGPFVMSGSFALRVDGEDPVSATLSAYFMSSREDSNENVDLESQRSRDHDTFQIVDLEPRVARPIGLNSYVISGTADLLLNGDIYSDDERVHIILRGGEELTPTNIEIDFRGDHRYSAANRFETLYGVVSSGFQ
jgi:hypothetical protein